MSADGDSGATAADDRERQLEELAAERNRLWAELNRRAAVERELEQCREHIELLETSLSWRVTAPLRYGKRNAERMRLLAGKARKHLRQS